MRRRSSLPRGQAAAAPRRARRRPARQASVRLRMTSRREAVAPMVDRILEAVAPAGLDEDRLTDLAVALAEALSNAAVHGHGLDPRRRVGIVVSASPGEVVVEVTDSGRGFDARVAPDPTDEDRKLLAGGRGIFLMRQLVDEVDYNDSGNTVRLTVRQRRPSTGS